MESAVMIGQVVSPHMAGRGPRMSLAQRLNMKWACWLNRRSIAGLEQVFDGSPHRFGMMCEAARAEVDQGLRLVGQDSEVEQMLQQKVEQVFTAIRG